MLAPQQIGLIMNDFKKEQKAALRKLCGYFNYSRADLANAMSVDITVVYSWFGRGRISANKAIEAEIITNKFVTKKELRPDVDLWSDE